MMNIAMFGHKIVPSREGGIEVAVGKLVSRMAAKGHHVTCFNRIQRHTQNITSSLSSISGVDLRSVWTIDKRGISAVTSSISAAIEATLGKYDIVHIHGEGPAAMCWLPRIFGRKVVVTIHGLDWKRAKWGKFASSYIHLGERIGTRFANKIIVLSESDKEYFLNQYGKKAVLIPNGVEPHTRQNADLITTKWGLKKDSYVLFVGRIVPEKGLEQLIEVWNSIHTDKKLVIAGKASDSEPFLNRLKAVSSDSVIFTDFVEGQALAELFSNAYFYCLPSQLEGMPISLLEAMSYGNCCLVSDIPGCLESVGSSAMVFRHNDIVDFKRKILKLLECPNLVEKYRFMANEHIKGMCNWDWVTAKTLELYTSLTKGQT